MYKTAIKSASFVTALFLGFGILVACGGGSHRACADPLTYTVTSFDDGSVAVDDVLYRGSSGGGRSGGGSSSGGSSSGARAPSNSGARSGGSSSGAKAPVKAPTNSGAGGSSGKVQAPTNSGARPVNPASRAASTPTGGVPTRISGNSYTYHGTGGVTHVYTYHPAAYWVHMGGPDPYNPFDPRNYNNILSPYYHQHIAC